MRLVCAGISHAKSPVEVRERLAIRPERLGEALGAARAVGEVSEVVIVSTCNRVEVYGAVGDGVSADGPLRAVATLHGVDVRSIEPFVEVYEGPDAARHLFSVASGLDSMVLGETQILGQVKEAYSAAQAAGFAGKWTHALFQRSFSVAKEVHTVTRVGEAKVSVGSVAVDFVRKVFDDLSAKTVLVIGVGKMGNLTLKHLFDAGVRRVLLTTRDFEKAKAVSAAVGAVPMPFDKLPEFLALADIVICSTGAPDYILRAPQVREAVRKRRREPVFFIDISVPRNLDPEIAGIDQVFLHDIDDLQAVVAQNLESRRREVENGRAIVEREAAEFFAWLATRGVDGTIADVTRGLQRVRDDEIERLFERLPEMDDRQREEVRAMADRMVKKVLGPSIAVLKEESTAGNGSVAADVIRRIFSAREPR